MKTLYCISGLPFTVDDEDYPLVSQFRWFKVKGNKTSYVATTGENGSTISLHRFLLNPAKGKIVHHLDGNGMNNCRSNLDCLTAWEHAQEHAKIKFREALGKDRHDLNFNPPKRKYPMLTFRLDEGLFAKIEIERGKSGQTLGQFVRAAVEAELERRGENP